jgi:hypothetical protein
LSRCVSEKTDAARDGRQEVTSLFRLNDSIRTEASHSRAIADLVEEEWGNTHSEEPIIRILGDVWRLDLEVVEAEFTLLGVHPALDQFKELASTFRREAEEPARRSGRALSASTRQASVA